MHLSSVPIKLIYSSSSDCVRFSLLLLDSYWSFQLDLFSCPPIRNVALNIYAAELDSSTPQPRVQIVSVAKSSGLSALETCLHPIFHDRTVISHDG
jgi:hypothetical protein